ncbi:MAG: hypothetical protein ABEJ74_01300 [Haloferacaceae archaeon]
MAVVPNDLETDRQPPMTIPLRHFVVALAFLAAGGLLGVGVATGAASGLATLAHVHLLLAGWVCITIMGAMTQFVPVWSAVALHSRRLAAVQLWLVAGGLAGFATALLGGWVVLLPVFGGAMLLGFWTFVYNVGRSLAAVDDPDVTERHFAVALGFFLLVTLLGFLLALDLAVPFLGRVSVSRVALLRAHATLAVFGAVLTTVLGALYQLGTMFTQTELHGVDRPLRRLEEAVYPLGVLLLATGRLLNWGALATVGAAFVLAGVLAFSAVLARKLVETRVAWTPMLARYAVVPPAMALWALLTAPAWLRDPLPVGVLFGGPGTVHLLVIGVVGFVVLGTLYHVVPFIVWVHRYSDRIGYEQIPMIDDLYDAGIAWVDFGCFLGGGALIVAADWASLDPRVSAAGGALFLVGVALFAWNLLGVIREHSPHSLVGLLVPRLAAGGDAATGADDSVTE